MNLIKPMKIIYSIVDNKKESKKIVIARFEVNEYQDDYPSFYYALADRLGSQRSYVVNFMKCVDINIQGKAVCSLKDDKFDLEYGFALARKRLLSKYYKQLNNAIAKDIAALSQVTDIAIKTFNLSDTRQKYYSKQVDYLASLKK